MIYAPSALVAVLCLNISVALAQQPAGDRGPPSQTFNGIAERLHQDLYINFSGDPDADYANVMIFMHQGAIDMAKTEIAFGNDSEMRRGAENTIKTEEAAISALRVWLAPRTKTPIAAQKP
jgi:uncharacterized protein (DUF305 family)